MSEKKLKNSSFKNSNFRSKSKFFSFISYPLISRKLKFRIQLFFENSTKLGHSNTLVSSNSLSPLPQSIFDYFTTMNTFVHYDLKIDVCVSNSSEWGCSRTRTQYLRKEIKKVSISWFIIIVRG